jgi:thiamine-phosphate pyrophosphorylase
MKSKKRLLRSSRLYAIFDEGASDEEEILRAAAGALKGGADIIQLRSKSHQPKTLIRLASRMGRLAKRYGAPFIVNDHVELALAADADGCHIGQGDINLSLARRLLGRKMIGVSCSNMKEAAAAERQDADYLGIGPVFRTPIKRGKTPRGVPFLKRMKRLKVPFFAIGGITMKNIYLLRKAGIRRVAVIRAISGSRDSRRAASALKEALL